MITDYEIQNDQSLFGSCLAKAASASKNLDVASKSKMFRFATWVRNLDGEYQTNWLRSAGKIAVAAFAVAGMIIFIPAVIGAILLRDFIKANQSISKVLNHEHRQIKDRELLIKTLGSSYIKQIPVVEDGKIGYIADVKVTYSNDRRGDAKEVRSWFIGLECAVIQSESNFLAVWAKNKTSNTKIVLSAVNDSTRWMFRNLSDHAYNKVISDFGPYVSNAKSIEALGKIIKGTHPEYELVTEFSEY